uniref:Uncharacterized protein n=1 Tax=Anopheles coluzzii TaxID=1518534 RepID=A0A8W7PSX6_ANOCL
LIRSHFKARLTAARKAHICATPDNASRETHHTHQSAVNRLPTVFSIPFPIPDAERLHTLLMIGCMHEANDAPCPTCGTYLLNPLSKSAVSGTSSSSSSEDESTTMDDSNTTFAGPSARSSYPTASTPAQDSTANSSGGIVEENAVLLEENRKLTRSLLELQVETERLKQQQNLLSGLGRRRDSLSGLSSTSQPLGSMGQNSPAPSYRSTGNYTSGIVADVVREIRDICRVREDA